MYIQTHILPGMRHATFARGPFTRKRAARFARAPRGVSRPIANRYCLRMAHLSSYALTCALLRLWQGTAGCAPGPRARRREFDSIV